MFISFIACAFILFRDRNCEQKKAPNKDVEASASDDVKRQNNENHNSEAVNHSKGNFNKTLMPLIIVPGELENVRV